MTDNYYVAKVVDVLSNGDAVLELPPEMIKNLQWETGDKLDITSNNQSIILKNLSKEERDAEHNNNQTHLR